MPNIAMPNIFSLASSANIDFILAFLAILLLLNFLLNIINWRSQANVDKNFTQLNNQINLQNSDLNNLKVRIEERLHTGNDLHQHTLQLLAQQQQAQQEQRNHFDQHQINSLKMLQESLQTAMAEVRQQITHTLNQNATSLDKQVTKLTTDIDQRLNIISGNVEKRLGEGFEKTTTVFTDVVKRLALIDEAQKKITELSGNVVNLQEVLTDKRSRGAFGEVQLSALIRNLMPESSFSMQHTLSNGKRADCMLFLPEPTGNIAIDAKFPLESYRLLTDIQLSEAERKTAQQQFKLDIRKHIDDISSKYIIAGETTDGAVMFIPAEAVFAEIHAHHPDLIGFANKAKVWLVSPTTMMAILTTALAVLKDIATRKQVHIIQQHLSVLGKDFARFQERMNDLSRHIQQAQSDVEQVHKSSLKISSRFNKIEKVELQNDIAQLNALSEQPALEEGE